MITKSYSLFSFIKTVILCICLLVCMSACKKDEQPQQPQTPQQPRVIISSINPTGGVYSTVVTISGSGFNANAANDTVKFNGIDAIVQQASATQLVAVVPKAAGTGPVTVKTGNQSGNGPVFAFTYTVTVSTLAGSGADGFAEGTGMAAQFSHPGGLATDGQGNIYVADVGNNRVRKITQAGVVSTLAGSGVSGFADGGAGAAQFNYPYEVAADAQGNIYVADTRNYRIRKITASGTVSTVAGSGVQGFANGTAAAAQFDVPLALVINTQGDIYVADAGNNCIRKITAAGVVSSFAGSGISGFADGNGNTAQFAHPSGIAMDAQGNLYVADDYNHRIRKITSAGVVSTIAGNGTPGFSDGNGSAAKFNYPINIAIDALENIYVTDYGNHRIRRITLSGTVSTLAGSGIEGFADGNGSTAKFASPWGVVTDAHGNIYVNDIDNKIRLITVQ